MCAGELTWSVIGELTDSRPVFLRGDAQNLWGQWNGNVTSQLPTVTHHYPLVPTTINHNNPQQSTVSSTLTAQIFCSCSISSETPGNAGVPCSISTKTQPAPLIQIHQTLLSMTAAAKKEFVHVWQQYWPHVQCGGVICGTQQHVGGTVPQRHHLWGERLTGEGFGPGKTWTRARIREPLRTLFTARLMIRISYWCFCKT